MYVFIRVAEKVLDLTQKGKPYLNIFKGDLGDEHVIFKMGATNADARVQAEKG